MNTKKWFLLLALLTFFNAIVSGQTTTKPFKVVIDAGHGGEAPGCIGKKSMEKNVTLAVALKVGKLISEHNDDVNVIYTRTNDATVEVYKRAEIANKQHADLFISIHCNAIVDRNAHGVETFVMGIEKSEANLAVAKKENADILLEKNFENNYEGFNPNSPEANIIFSLYSSAYLKNSVLLADKVQRNLVRNTKLFDRNVKQAGFWVLYKVAMPSILIELGFLSNPTEEAFMLKEETQNIMALSIYNAFIEYLNATEGKNKQTLPVNVSSKPYSSTETKPVESKPQETKPAETKPAETKPQETKPAESKADGQVNTASDDLQIRFRVQFFASPEDIALTDRRFNQLQTVKKYYENKLWKFTSGDAKTYEEVQNVLQSVKKIFPDAFVVAFQKEKKIPVNDAKSLLNK